MASCRIQESKKKARRSINCAFLGRKRKAKRRDKINLFMLGLKDGRL